MPYFLYRISAARILTPLDSFPDYRSARDRARALRADPAALDGDMVKIVFARDPDEAETLLKAKKEKILHEDD